MSADDGSDRAIVVGLDAAPDFVGAGEKPIIQELKFDEPVNVIVLAAIGRGDGVNRITELVNTEPKTIITTLDPDGRIVIELVP